MNQLDNIPPLYSQETSKDPTVYLVITCMSSIWLITEYNPEQKIGFGYCQILAGCGELGYVSLTEIESLPYPVEYLPTKRPLSEVKEEYLGDECLF